MKRLIALFLVALMLVMALAACNNTEEPKPTEKPTEAPTEKPTEGNVPETPDFESAKAFLKAQVLKSDTAITAVKSFDVPAQIKIGTLTYTVEWASSLETVTVAASATEGFCTVTIPDTNAEEVTYVLTATIKYGEESVNLEINGVLPVIDNAGITSDLQENVAYKMFLYQVTFAQNLYATHEMDQDKYFKGTNDPKAAPDFFAEKVDGGFKFYTMIDGAKKYVNAYLVYDETQAKYSKRLNYADSTDNVWTYEADTNAWFVNLPQAEETVKYVLGTYGEFKTFCISEASYITPSNTGVSQFPASFIIKEVAESKTPDEEYVPEYEEYSIGDALELEDGTGVIIFGVVSEIKTAWSDQYKNISVNITDGKDTYYLYRLATNVEVGDAIVVTGKVGSYNGAKQIAAGATAEIIAEKTLAEAVALEDGAYVLVKGTVSEIKTAWSEQYGNISVNITDGTNTLYLYRLATNVKVDDVVTVVGKVGSYNGAKQIAQGAFAIVEGGEEGGEETPDEPTTVTIADALAAEDGTKVVFKGVVSEIKTAYSEQYKNISVNVTDGVDTIYCYRLSANVAVGDVVVITGESSSYNGAKQIAAGATAEITKPVALDAAMKLDDGADVVIMGKVSEIKTAYSEQYKNISVNITDGTNTVYCYRLAANVVVGDVIVVTGKVGSYNDAKQIAAGATAVIIEKASTEGGEEEGEENSAFVLAANKGTLAEDKLSISWTTDNFTVLAEKDDSTTAIRVDDGDHFRLYQNSKMTITAADGKKITKVILTCTGGKNFSADSIVTEGVTAAIDGAVATLTVDGSVDAIVIDAVAQTRIASIEVVFA